MEFIATMTEVSAAVMREKVAIPMMIQMMENILAWNDFGALSPYPTVVMLKKIIIKSHAE